MQAGRIQGNTVYHEDLNNPKLYLKTNRLNNNQVSLLFKLRNWCIRGFKDNFHGYYKHFPKWDICNNETDSQDHVLKQNIQWNHDEVKYEHIYGTLQQQITVTILISNLLEVQAVLLKEQQGLPGLSSTGHSDS